MPLGTARVWAVRAGDHSVPMAAVAMGIIRTAKRELPEELMP